MFFLGKMNVNTLHLELDSWFSHSSERICLPVDLLHLLPHDYIKTGAVLIAKDKPSVVIICYCIYMKRPLKIHTVKCCVTCVQEKKEFKILRN